MQQCALIYVHTMHFASFHYSIESISNVFLTPNFQCTQPVLKLDLMRLTMNPTFHFSVREVETMDIMFCNNSGRNNQIFIKFDKSYAITSHRENMFKTCK